MNTQIAEIIGRKKFASHKGEKTTYVDSSLHITRFWGGKMNGQMLQLTISNNKGHSYIQLTEKQVYNLSVILNEAFNDTIYPSE